MPLKHFGDALIQNGPQKCLNFNAKERLPKLWFSSYENKSYKFIYWN